MPTRVLITGPSSGIGIPTPLHRAAAGGEFVMVSLDRVRGQAAVVRVAALATGRKPTLAAAEVSNSGPEITQAAQEAVR